MNTRKKHHYIPQFYLKRFSVMEEGKCIGLYNISDGRFVANASVKNSACEDYLYGVDDVVEAELGKLESTIGAFFNYWTTEKMLIPPQPDSNALKLLKRFILYQFFRTPKAGKWIEDSTKEAFEVYLLVIPDEERKKFDGLDIVSQDPVLEALIRSTEFEDLMDYLDCRFLVNLSDLLFITSDAPVVLYNQFMEKQDLYIGSTGLAIKGLQIFYPIHPRLMIVFYDPITYSTDAANCMKTESIEEVHQLNILQFINCKNQLFFDDRISKEYIKVLKEEYHGARNLSGKARKMIRISENKYQYFTAVSDVPINLNIACLKVLPPDKDFDGSISPLRHPSLERKISEIDEDPD